MEYTQRMIGPVCLLLPAGRIELSNADAFRDALITAIDGVPSGSGAVILDLSGLEYISSAGLRSLMIASKTAKARGVGLGVAAMQPIVHEIFSISRFNLVLACFDTVQDAVAKLAAIALPALTAP